MSISGGESRPSRLKVAVVGSGISGLSAAWLLSQHHDVTLYEKDPRAGGHAHTAMVQTPEGEVPVDTGFIVFNPKNYPNLTALFDCLGIETAPSEMSFGVSLDDGAFEYGGAGFASLLAQPTNILRPRFWSMLSDLVRFYRNAPADMRRSGSEEITLGDFLIAHGYGDAFVEDHLLPMAGAIWSAAPDELRSYPAGAFIRFFENHGLLNLTDRPQWRTVVGGSVRYVSSLAASTKAQIRIGSAVRAISRLDRGIVVETGQSTERYDRILIATHADEALAILADPSDGERRTLSAFRYTSNVALLHSDAQLMPKRKGVWSSWNYIGRRGAPETDVHVTYWMNRLQPLPTSRQLFVTLNPRREPAGDALIRTESYTHPLFTLEALRAQRRLPALQGDRNTWFCGAYFGSGFHEDGLKSGLDAAEAMGGAMRPWSGSKHQTAKTFESIGAGL